MAVAAIIVVRALDSDEPVPVTTTTLGNSVTRVVGARSGTRAEPLPCSRGRRFQYRCPLGGGGPVYRVTLTGGGCWDAVNLAGARGGGPFPARASGCVRASDQPD